MDKQWQMVREFHRLFNIPMSRTPVSLIDERRRFRAALINEEVVELIGADQIEQQADAFIDILYLTLGGLVEMGIRPERIFEIVHEANMKKRGIGGDIVYREDGKVLKPADWKSPEPLIKAEIDTQYRHVVETLHTSG